MNNKVFNSWSEVDDAVRRMGELDIAIERIQGEATIRINQIKEEAKGKGQHLTEERKGLEKAIQAFCETRKDEFVKKRSMALNFGTIGYRLVRSVAIPRDRERVAALIRSIKAFGLADCIRVEEKPDKDIISQLDDATIAKLGLRRTVRDNFRVQPDMERIHHASDAA